MVKVGVVWGGEAQNPESCSITLSRDRAPLSAAPSGMKHLLDVKTIQQNLFEARDYSHSLIPNVASNKARKLASLLYAHLPDNHIVSCGGAQSNAMLALAHVAKHKNAKFTYHTRPLPKWLRENPNGNLKKALHLRMELVEHTSVSEYQVHRQRIGRASLPGHVPQGGAWPMAETGVAALASSINDWYANSKVASPLKIVVPAGTGTTALFLSKHISAGIHVYAVPCVGNADSLWSQMLDLDGRCGKSGKFPEVLEPPADLNVPFGSVSPSIYSVWREAGEQGVSLDLLYGPPAWSVSCSLASQSAGSSIMYMNTGGHEGLESQLSRYARAGLHY